MKCAKLEGQDVTDTILRLDKLSSMYNINLVISVSLDQDELSEALHDKVLVSL